MSLRQAKQSTIFWGVALIGLGLVTYTQLKPEPAPAERTILAMGMAPQIGLIEDIASEQGWKVDCTGNSDEMTVVRLAPGFWPWRGSHDDAYESLTLIATSHQSGPRVDEAGPKCDLPDGSFRINLTDLETDMVLGVGSREFVEPLFEVAKNCEIRGAKLEKATAEDRAAYGGPVPPDAIRLVVEPRLESRTGPLSCFGIIARHASQTHS